MWVHPDSVMARLGGGPHTQSRPGQINGANFFRPQAVFGHKRKPPERPKAARGADMPAGFFHHLAVQRRDRVFAFVNTATGQLVFRRRVVLKRRQQAVLV